MNTAFTTAIINTKTIPKTKYLVFGSVYIAANIYLFVIDKAAQNTYLKWVATCIIFASGYFIFESLFKKPKPIGLFNISKTAVCFTINGVTKHISISKVDRMLLKYTGYGGWLQQNYYGTKNYIKLITTDKERHTFEISFKDKADKTKFKTIVNNTIFDGKFSCITINNSQSF